MLDEIAQISDSLLPYEKKTVYYNKQFFNNLGYLDSNSFLNENFKKEYSMDIYSLGNLLWEIMSEKIPFSQDKHNSLLIKKIKNGYREKDIPGISSEYVNLYKECWKEDSLTRPKIKDVYKKLLYIKQLLLFKV